MSFQTIKIVGDGTAQAAITNTAGEEAVITTLIAYNSGSADSDIVLTLGTDVVVTESALAGKSFSLKEKLNIPTDSVLYVTADAGTNVTVSYYQQAIDVQAAKSQVQLLVEQAEDAADLATRAADLAMEAANTQKVDGLLDVEAPNPAAGDALVWDDVAKKWINGPVASSSGAAELAELTDVDFGTPTDGQVLTYDATTQKSKFTDPAGGDVEEAPTDGKQYARKDAAWEEVVASGGDFITLDFPLLFVEGEPQPTMLAPDLFPDQTKNYKGKLYYAFNELYGEAIIGLDGEATYTYRVFDTITLGEDLVETPSITVNIEVDFLSRWPLFTGGEIMASGFIVTGTSYTGNLPIYPDDYKLLMKGGMEDVGSGYSEGLYARMVQSNGENYWSRINLDSYFRFPYSVSSGYNLFIGDSFVQAPSIINNLPTANKPYMYNGRSETWVEYKGDEIKDVQDVTGKKWLRTRNANSAEWVLYEEPSPGIEEAPSDGKAYVRKDEAWEETSPATGVSRAASNYIVRAVKDQIVEDGKGFYSGAAWSEELSLWVLCSTIGIYTAPYDSNTWTKVHSTGGSNVIWVSELSLFVVLGTYYVITSSDGTTWTQRDFPSGAPIKAIAWSPEQGKMIAVSDAANTEGNIISSTDGINWTRSNDLPTSGGGRGEDIIWAPGLSKWVTCGTGGFRISSDGVTWTKVGTPSGVAKNPHSVTYNPSDGSLSATVGITGSSSRAILQSTNGGTSWVKISEVETNGSIATIDWIDDLGMYILTSTDNNKKSFDLLKFTTILGGGSGPNGLGWGASIASIIFPTNAYGTHSIKKTI